MVGEDGWTEAQIHVLCPVLWGRGGATIVFPEEAKGLSVSEAQAADKEDDRPTLAVMISPRCPGALVTIVSLWRARRTRGLLREGSGQAMGTQGWDAGSHAPRDGGSLSDGFVKWKNTFILWLNFAFELIADDFCNNNNNIYHPLLFVQCIK